MTAARMVMSYAFTYRQALLIVRSLKLFFAIFLLTTCYIILATTPAFAQTSSATSGQANELSGVSSLPTTNYQLPTTQYFPPQSPHFASMAIYNFSHALSCILIGQSSIAPCLEYKTFADAQGMVKSVPILNSVITNQGALGLITSSLGDLYKNPPIRSSEFIANFGQQIGFVKEANAQVSGSGSGVLGPIFKLWEVSRNIAYLVMIVIFVVVGLMVMLRQKLNPQTVVSIQMALPELVIGLVMITFSYFLASLITDLAFVGTGIVGYYFQQVQSPGAPNLLDTLSTENVVTVMGRFANTLTNADYTPFIKPLNNLDGWAGVAFAQFVYFLAAQFADQGAVSPLSAMGSFITGFAVTKVTGGGWGAAFTQASAAGNAAQAFSGIVSQIGTRAWANPEYYVNQAVKWIILAVMLFTLFRLLIALVSQYLSIIFYTIFAPFFFLAASLPGRQGLITTWIRNMLCHVLSFPAVIGVIYFAYYLLTGSTDVTAQGAAFQSSWNYGILHSGATGAVSGGVGLVAGNSTLPLLGGLNADSIRLILAIGALFATPSIPEMICRALGKQSPSSQMLGGAVIAGWAGGQKYLNQGQQQMSGGFGTLAKSGNPFQRQLRFSPVPTTVDGKETYQEYYDAPSVMGRLIPRWFKGSPTPTITSTSADTSNMSEAEKLRRG